MASSTPRQQLLASLKGQSFHVPDLWLAFQNWPRAFHPDLKEIEAALPEKFLSLTTSPEKLRKLKKIESGSFTALWWPRVSTEKAKVLSWFIVWLFVWDDEIDAEVGPNPLAGDIEAAQYYRNDTIQHIRSWLGFTEEKKSLPSNRIIAFFKFIGDAVRDEYTDEQRQLLLKQLEWFVEASELEQKRRLSPDLPTVDEYMSWRLDVSAVRTTCAMAEYAHGIRLSAGTMCSAEMSTLWDQTSILIIAVNDLLSLQKELQEQTLDSLLPLFYRDSGDIQQAVSAIVHVINGAVQTFDEAAAKLLHDFSQEEKIAQDLSVLIDTLRYNCTGNLQWSLITSRYGICQESMVGGVTIHLD